MAVGRGRSTTPFIAAGADHFREASAPCSSALWLTPRLSAAQSLGKEDARLQKKKCGQFHSKRDDFSALLITPLDLPPLGPFEWCCTM
jgi:hypothetical protein